MITSYEKKMENRHMTKSMEINSFEEKTLPFPLLCKYLSI